MNRAGADVDRRTAFSNLIRIPMHPLLTFLDNRGSRTFRYGIPMGRYRKDLGERKHIRIEVRRPGFVIPAPDAPWIECFIVDISESGVCLDVGALAVPKMFGLAFTSCGTVVRVCLRAWRRGELVGARFVTAKQLRRGEQIFSDPQLQKMPAD
jgi:hypothetical protein